LYCGIRIVVGLATELELWVDEVYEVAAPSSVCVVDGFAGLEYEFEEREDEEEEEEVDFELVLGSPLDEGGCVKGWLVGGVVGMLLDSEDVCGVEVSGFEVGGVWLLLSVVGIDTEFRLLGEPPLLDVPLVLEPELDSVGRTPVEMHNDLTTVISSVTVLTYVSVKLLSCVTTFVVTVLLAHAPPCPPVAPLVGFKVEIGSLIRNVLLEMGFTPPGPTRPRPPPTLAVVETGFKPEVSLVSAPPTVFVALASPVKSDETDEREFEPGGRVPPPPGIIGPTGIIGPPGFQPP